MASNGCFIAVLIARSQDRIPLCVYADDNYHNSDAVRKQIQFILERMDTPTNGCHYQSYDHKDCVYFTFQDAATKLSIIAAVNKLLLRSSGDINGMNKLACGLLDMVFAEFINAYSVTEFGASGVRPYQFIKFDAAVQKCVARAIQQDRMSKDTIASSGRVGANGAVVSGVTSRRQVNPHYEALRQELTDVHMVMRKNLEDLMKRGEKLETMSSYSVQLVDQSSRYYKKTVQLNRGRLLRLYGPPAVVALIFLICMYIYWF